MSGASRYTCHLAILMLTLASAGFARPAMAQTAQNISTYTSTAEKNCRTIRGDADDSGIRVCRGPAGLVVVVSEGDLRETVSAGRNREDAGNQPAAQAWFGPFSSTNSTIEWRHADKGKPPLAMIQRWHLADIDDEDKNGRPKTKQMLVVTRLPPGPVCHVAYVDVAANPDANDPARGAADTLARDFNCNGDKVKVIGASGRAVQLAAPR